VFSIAGVNAETTPGIGGIRNMNFMTCPNCGNETEWGHRCTFCGYIEPEIDEDAITFDDDDPDKTPLQPNDDPI
jgi:hypothetical protein